MTTKHYLADQICIAKSYELLDAVKRNNVAVSFGVNFTLFESKNYIFSSNLYDKTAIFKVEKNLYYENREAVTLAMLILPVINTFFNCIRKEPLSKDDLNFWQYPCSTEQNAFHRHLNIKPADNIDTHKKIVNSYLPIPWASYIDKNNFPVEILLRIKRLINAYKEIATAFNYKLKVHSVCQHIYWEKIVEMANWIGVTDLHLSHKCRTSMNAPIVSQTKTTLHAWPLIAVNYTTPELSSELKIKSTKDKNLLASFIGAHMKHYIDNSRLILKNLCQQFNRNDVIVEVNSKWHFEKNVYQEQVAGLKLSESDLNAQKQRTERYNRILSNSKFSFCPVGAGPNTLRLWESIAVGAIPVVFSDDLSIFHDDELGRELFSKIVFTRLNNSLLDTLTNFKDIEKYSEQIINLYNQFEKKICF